MIANACRSYDGLGALSSRFCHDCRAFYFAQRHTHIEQAARGRYHLLRDGAALHLLYLLAHLPLVLGLQLMVQRYLTEESMHQTRQHLRLSRHQKVVVLLQNVVQGEHFTQLLLAQLVELLLDLGRDDCIVLRHVVSPYLRHE